jgi:PAS domain S-box-containing protein
MMRESEMAVFEARHMTKDGLVIPTEVNARSVVIGGATLTISTCRDITERKKAQDALAEEKERLVVTLRSIGDGVIVTDTDGTVTLMNRVAEELTGWHGEEGLGRPLPVVFNIINEGTRLPCENPVQKVLSKGLIVGISNHTALIKRDGTELIIADSAAPIRDRGSRIVGVVLVFRDITAQYRIEAELQKMAKLESLGLLAGGLAHDFNNLLTAIMGNISFVKMHIEPGTKDFERLAAAESATDRATDLTRQLLTFAKGGAPIKKATAIADIVMESVGFALSGSNVGCEYSVPEGLWAADVDKGQMAQVFNNLAINALHAMPDGGTIKISFENVCLPENSFLNLKKGDYVKIIFKDQGSGISEEHIARIFDPYFTTKKQGSGLGLATAFSILKRHDGYITVESEVAAGTSFYIYLPATVVKSLVSEKDEYIHSRGSGKVLVMDDEAIVRDTAGDMLKELGYEAGFAVGGDEAISIYKEALAEGDPYYAVIMDLTIPGGMGGKDAVMKILEIDPDARVIVSSGYSTDPIISDYKKYGFCDVLSKPYRFEEISNAMQRVCKRY